MLHYLTTNKLCTTADLTLRDGRTLTHAVRGNATLTSYCRNTLSSPDGRTLPTQHHSTAKPTPPALGEHVVWLDHKRYQGEHIIRYGKVLSQQTDLTTVTPLGSAASRQTAHDTNRDGKPTRRSVRRRTGAAEPYTTLAEDPTEHAHATVDIPTHKLTAIDALEHDGHIQVWTDPDWARTALQPLSRSIASIDRARRRRRRRTRTVESSDDSDASPTSSSDSDSDHDAARHAKPLPRPARTKFTLRNVRIAGIHIGERYMYMRTPCRVLEVRQGASGSNQTADRGNIDRKSTRLNFSH